MGTFRHFKKSIAVIGVATSSVFVVKYGQEWLSSTVRATVQNEAMDSNALGTTNGKSLNGNGYPEALKDMKPLSASIFFRHGARTPLRHLPNVEEAIYHKEWLLRRLPKCDIPVRVVDPEGGPRPRALLDERYLKVMFKGGSKAGQLTTLGQDQCYTLGRRIYTKYIEELQMIPKHFDPSQVVIRSTNINRTIESMTCVMAGLYGTEAFDEDNPLVIPVNMFEDEVLFPNHRFCTTLRRMASKVRRDEGNIPGLKEITEKINSIIGHEGNLDMMMWLDHIWCRTAHGQSMPKFMQELEPEITSVAVSVLQHHMSGLPEDRGMVLRLATGPQLHLVHDSFQKVINNESPSGLNLYAVHDSTLVPLLTTLMAFDNNWPPYAADVRFELWQDKDNQHWVHMTYCDKPLVPVGHGFSTNLLTFEEFTRLISPFKVDVETHKNLCQDMKAARETAAFWDVATDIALSTASDEEDDDDEPAPRNM